MLAATLVRRVVRPVSVRAVSARVLSRSMVIINDKDVRIRAIAIALSLSLP